MNIIFKLNLSTGYFLINYNFQGVQCILYRGGGFKTAETTASPRQKERSREVSFYRLLYLSAELLAE